MNSPTPAPKDRLTTVRAKAAALLDPEAHTMTLTPEGKVSSGWLFDLADRRSSTDKVVRTLIDGALNTSGATLAALERITDERARQVAVEGYSPEVDAQRGTAALTRAGQAYLLNDPTLWPWMPSTWKPKTQIRNLERAGALALAALAADLTNVAAVQLHTEAVTRLAAILQSSSGDAHAALTELVRLKDGPRDAAYERDKRLAWQRAREVLTAARDATATPGTGS